MKLSGGPRMSRLSEENLAGIVDAFGEDPYTPLRKVTAQLDVPQSSVQ